jgi:hypothetical protein
MDCAINPKTESSESQSDYQNILKEMGQTGDRKMEVTPKGCNPVSEDVCKSGFMAPSENVTFPENALATCCKCKEGEACSYCANKDSCTEEEKALFVTNLDCFTGTETGGSSPSSASASASEPDMKSDMTKKLSSWKWYILAAIIIILGLIFMFIWRRP